MNVVLVHGFGEEDSIFNQLKSYLIHQGYSVLTYCLPGVGGSGHNENMSTIEQQAVLLQQLLSHLQIEKVVLLGHSLGGYIGLAFAQKYPNFLVGFGLLHSTSFADTDEKRIARTKGIQLMQEYGAAAFVASTLPNLFATESKQILSQEIENMEKQAASFSTPALQLQYAAMRDRADTSTVLSELSIPVLIVAGMQDVPVPYTHSVAQAKLPNICYFTLLENVGHMSMLEAPDKLHAAVYHYLSNL